ncbi:hypothetical protein EG329_011096 [Mollisiaceae sp. DMI_Dod_QoI]|nr:hypothetical protein EG329_011096 [Helotiales sp. DMI_Dod_QoI]
MPKAPQNFHVFPNLPTELRHRIWHFALPCPAVIEIEFCPLAGRWFCPSTSLPLPCSLLRSCLESREVYLKHYKPSIREVERRVYSRALEGCNHDFGNEENAGQRLVYLDLNIDIVYIGPSSQGELCFTKFSLECLLDIPAMKGLRYLAVEYAEWNNDLANELREIETLALFPKLERMTVLVEDMNWVDFMLRKKSQAKGQIEIVDCRDTEWLRSLVTRVEDRWKDSLQAFEGEVKFEFEVMGILRGGEERRRSDE